MDGPGITGDYLMAAFSDDFNRPDSTSIGNWLEGGGNWSIIGNQLAYELSAAYGIVVTNPPLDTPNHFAEATVTAGIGAESIGIIARADNFANDYYLWRNDGSTWRMYRSVSGSFIDIGGYSAPLVAGDVIRIECNRNVIKGFVNGVELLSVTDNGITTGNYAGLRTSPSATVRYDNFTASDLSADDGTGFMPFFHPV